MEDFSENTELKKGKERNIIRQENYSFLLISRNGQTF